MKRFKKILAVVDEATRNNVLLYRASALASDNNGQLKILGVAPPVQKSLAEKLTARFDLEAKPLVQEQLQKQLARYEARCQAMIPTTVAIRTGKPFIEIILEVLDGDHDLVMVLSSSPESRKSNRRGSTEMHLLRKCPCPVWVCQPREQVAYKRILVAIDVASDEPQEMALNRKLLELARSLAKIDGAELHIATCWHAVGESLLLNRGVPGPDIAAYVGDVKRDVHNRMDVVLDELKLDQNTSHVSVLNGDPEKLIPKLIHVQKIDLLVMGTMSRSGVPGFFIGSTAERILSLLPCSVLAVKPDGFISPVIPEDRV
ncbi:MAG: universal stress protein [Verrucomicrobia bacterium]|nr:universal stress protein [Verrucomicrobiota bacterium]